MDRILVGEEVLSESGPVLTVRRYYAGWHPEMGTLHMGLTGPETVVETTVVRATHVVRFVARLVAEKAA